MTSAERTSAEQASAERTVADGVASEPLVGRVWRRGRLWLALAAVLLLGALLVGSVSAAPGRPLDPGSARRNGSKALARVLGGYGVTVSTTSSLESVPVGAPVVLVTSPDDYSDAQLRRLRAITDRLVLVRPGTRATAAVLAGVSPDPLAGAESDPGCAVDAARAAGRVEPPADTRPYAVPAGPGGATACYGGTVVFAPDVVLLGSAELLQNDTLDRHGVAALDVNVLSADRAAKSVTWLLPGADADGSGPASIWDLFPGGAHRAFLWLIVLGALIVLWRGRNLGPAVREPLPVIVRSAEVVEGLGRLYDRAGARDRAATALRRATTVRLAARLGMPREATASDVAAAITTTSTVTITAASDGRAARSPLEVRAVLDGPVPADDAALVTLAGALDRLERDAP